MGRLAARGALPSHDEVGRALSSEAERRLLEFCAKGRSRALHPAVTLALSTGMRSCELQHLRWDDVDLMTRQLTVRKSKTSAGTNRVVPLNSRAAEVLLTWASKFPDREGSHYVFPTEHVGAAGDEFLLKISHTNPTKPTGRLKVAWLTYRRSLFSKRRRSRRGLTQRGHKKGHSRRAVGPTLARKCCKAWLLGLDSNSKPAGRRDPDVQPGAPFRPSAENGSSGWTRTSNPPVNSRMLCH